MELIILNNIKNYLAALDFDGTIADTFIKGPKGIGVNEATALALTDILGSGSHELYTSSGGLKNRAPSELIFNMLNGPNKQDFLTHAKIFFESELPDLNTLVPEGKGVPLVWDDQHPEKIIGELFVRQKLSYLMDQIGTELPDGRKWPPLCKGFTEFWNALNKLKKDGVGINTAIISSGHDLFIKKVFDLYGLTLPDILVTEDDIRGKHYPKEMGRRVKPGSFPLALAHLKWLRLNNPKAEYFTSDQPGILSAKESRSRMIYFGDDPIKDGQLANRAQVLFGWFNPNNKEGNPPFSMQFTDWEQPAKLFQQNKTQLIEGKPFNDILNIPFVSKEGKLASLERQ